jgi:hypothetical protein
MAVSNVNTANAPAILSANSRQSYRVSLAAYQRTADATAYVAGDVISDGNEAGMLEFPLAASRKGGSGAVIRAFVGYEDNEATPPDLELYLFDDEGTGFQDNAALALVSLDLEKAIGVIDFTGSNAKIVNAAASPSGLLMYTTTLDVPIPFAAEADSASIFGLLVTRTGFTPSSAVKVWVKLGIVAD